MFPSYARKSSLAFFFGLLLGVALWQPENACSATFQVSPTQVFLSAKSPSALLTLRNESTGTLRFQLSLFTWDQSPRGELLLSPTDDIVFFPSLVTLAPGEERKVRVGTATPVTSTEKTYRVFVEELPSLSKKSDGSEQGGQVQLLTRMGIPIFIRPDKPIVEGGVQGTVVRGGVLSFQVKNAGNIHFVVEKIRVKGYGVAGEELFERQLEGWYILSGGSRLYELEFPEKECTKVKALDIDVQAEKKTFKDRIEMTLGACAK